MPSLLHNQSSPSGSRVRRTCILAAILVAGCGSSHHNTSTTTSTASSSTAAAASPAPSGVRARVLMSNELAGFRPAGLSVSKTAAGWMSAEQGVPPQQIAAEKRMLRRDGFRLGVREDLMSGGTAGVSIAEQFRSTTAARDAFRLYASQFKAAGASAGAYAPFKVSGIPGAVGFSLGAPNGGINVAFADGAYYYLVGQEGGGTATIANLVDSARHLYRRVHA